jgi:hypothetical protein
MMIRPAMEILFYFFDWIWVQMCAMEGVGGNFWSQVCCCTIRLGVGHSWTETRHSDADEEEGVVRVMCVRADDSDAAADLAQIRDKIR